MTTLTPAERAVMEHACAWTHKSRLYRNHFVAGDDHADWPTLQALCERGLMYVSHEPSEFVGGMTTFSVTDAGLTALAEKDGAT